MNDKYYGMILILKNRYPMVSSVLKDWTGLDWYEYGGRDVILRNTSSSPHVDENWSGI